MVDNKTINFQEKKRELRIKKQQDDLSKNVVICYIQGTDPEGHKVFSYVAIPSESLAEFNEAILHGNVDVDEYGYRIVSGEGEPCDSVKHMMAIEYGFEE